jgi:hypothetical protein
MKKWSLLFFMSCCFLTTTIASSSNLVIDNDEIDLHGDLSDEKIRSLTNPIRAYLSDLYIEVNFQTNLGAISVSIYDEAENVVYQQLVTATSNGQQLFIPVSNFESGAYTIRFVNLINKYLSGSFEK